MAHIPKKKKKTDPNEILPADPKDVKEHRKFMNKLSSKKGKDVRSKDLVKQLSEDVKTYKRGEQAKKMATDEFRQSMKKPGASDKYAGQAWEKDSSKRIQEKKLKNDILRGALNDYIRGKSPYHTVANPIPKHKPPKPKGKSYNIGGLISGALGTPPGAAPVPQGTPPGQGTPKKGPSPAAAKDAELKRKADEKKRIDLAVPQRVRKGGSIKNPPNIEKNYANLCKTGLATDV